MPTGYTSELCKKDVSFKKFVMTCARAMGACISMRDSSLDTPVPSEFRPDEYHRKELLKATEELRRLTRMSEGQAGVRAEGEYRAELSRHEKHVREAEQTKKRLLVMLAKVCEWQPPTPEHVDLKHFMVQQLEETLKHDGRVYGSPPTKKEPKVWLEEQLARAKRDIEYHGNEQKKEEERCLERNRWILDLRNSLGGGR